MLKRTVLLLLSGIIAVFMLSAAGCAEKETVVELDKYVSISAVGYDSGGTASYSFDYDAFKSDYSGKINLSSQCDKDIADLVNAGKELGRSVEEVFLDIYVRPELSKESGLSNGETITLVWHCDDENAMKNFGVTLKYSDITYTVSGLNEAEEYDPFEHITVSFSGIAPNGSLVITKDGSPEVNDIQFSSERSSGLSNGNLITVAAEPVGSAEAFTKKYGKILKHTGKDYAVEGLDRYAAKLDEIPDEVYDKMDKQLQDAFKAHAESSWEKGHSVTIRPVGIHFLNKREGMDVSPNNYYYIEYEIKYSYPKDNIKDFTYYWYGYFTDIMILNDGTCSVDLDNYTISESSRMWGGDQIEGDYLELPNGFYVAGYADKDTLETDQIFSKTEQYHSEGRGWG